MPGINGIETFELLREVDPQVKVILCSGYSEGTVTAQIEHNSLTAFLQKPVKVADLLNVIKSALATQV
ncbi:MAG: response regulator, partial [Caldilineaceae bacterium]|nr:response regulator [Caldilineaceae bacterium]